MTGKTCSRTMGSTSSFGPTPSHTRTVANMPAPPLWTVGFLVQQRLARQHLRRVRQQRPAGWRRPTRAPASLARMADWRSSKTLTETTWPSSLAKAQ